MIVYPKWNYNNLLPFSNEIQDEQHPLYARLTSAVEPSGNVSWNFEKFLVSKQGEVVARFKSSVKPDSPELIAAIERELAK
jgi:glutathione peroxidase